MLHPTVERLGRVCDRMAAPHAVFFALGALWDGLPPGIEDRLMRWAEMNSALEASPQEFARLAELARYEVERPTRHGYKPLVRDGLTLLCELAVRASQA